MRILVTGGVGFIGSHLVNSLLADSNKVYIADRRKCEESPTLQFRPNNLTGFVFDLCDVKETSKFIQIIKPDVIFHLAAQPLSVLSNTDPLRTVRDNILGTYSVLEAIRNHSSKTKLIYTSSACFYGIPSSPPPLEEDNAPAVGHYIYTATKISADYAVQHYRKIYGLDCICARMVNVYGPGDLHFERIVPRLIIQALNREKPSLTQSDGRDVLSFLYISDAVRALRLLVDHQDHIESCVWNVAGSPPISIFELMKKIFAKLNFSQTSFTTIGPRCGKPVHKYLDGKKMATELFFTPVMDIEKGLELTIDWYKSYLYNNTVVHENDKSYLALENTRQ